MMNRVTRNRLDVLASEYRDLSRRYPEAMEQIAISELAESVHQSNAIENSTLTLADTTAVLAGRQPVGRKNFRELLEARNLARVTTDLYAKPNELNIDLVLRWHGILLTGINDSIAGRFRRAGEWVTVGGHIGANPEFVSGLVADALRQHREALGGGHRESRPPTRTVDCLEAVARLHCEFEVIHPFVDGNGRIGRVIINKVLADCDLPPVIIRAKGKERDYYPLLERYAKTDDYDGMTRLLALLLSEAIHKRTALITRPKIVPLSKWARESNMSAATAINRAKRQTLPAFRIGGRWMIASDTTETLQ